MSSAADMLVERSGLRRPLIGYSLRRRVERAERKGGTMGRRDRDDEPGRRGEHGAGHRGDRDRHGEGGRSGDHDRDRDRRQERREERREERQQEREERREE